jgi:WD40 repeat protein
MNNYGKNKILLSSSSSDGYVKIWDLSSDKFINICRIPNYYTYSNSAALPHSGKYSDDCPFFSYENNIYKLNELLTEDKRNNFQNFEEKDNYFKKGGFLFSMYLSFFFIIY